LTRKKERFPIHQHFKRRRQLQPAQACGNTTDGSANVKMKTMTCSALFIRLNPGDPWATMQALRVDVHPMRDVRDARFHFFWSSIPWKLIA
jgi:hypothetical protein